MYLWCRRKVSALPPTAWRQVYLKPRRSFLDCRGFFAHRASKIAGACPWRRRFAAVASRPDGLFKAHGGYLERCFPARRHLFIRGIFYYKDRGKTREGAWPRAPRALRSAAIPPIYYFWGEPRYARAHPRPDGLFLLPHTPSTCDSAPVGRHVRNRGESACSSASRSATGGHGKPRRTRPVPDHPVRGFSTAA